MKKYETEAEERAQQINQIRVQGNATARCADMGGQGDFGREVWDVLTVHTQDCKEQLDINAISYGDAGEPYDSELSGNG